MAKKKKILCTICARKGSKGIKNKNLQKINSIPLVSHTIFQAQKSKLFDAIVVSSDSDKILKISKNKKVDFLIKRSRALSGDDISKVDVIKNVLKKTENFTKTHFDIIIDLDVTSPLRQVSDIKKALNKFKNSRCENLVTASKARKNPFFNQVQLKNGILSIPCKTKKRINSRQMAPDVYDLNASIYIWKKSALLNSKDLINSKTSMYIMPFSRSIDIDDKIELFIVKNLMKKYQ